jgi:membrane protein implicated in regulation of membrane protease activity
VGGKFWLALLGGTVALVVGLILVWFVFSWAWYAWGFFGALIALLVVLLGISWVVDRRDKRRYEGLA